MGAVITPSVNNSTNACCLTAVYGLNAQRAHCIISSFKVTYKSTIQVSRNFNALFTKTLENSDTLRLMRASVSSTQEPMKPESRPSSEQGLDSAVNLEPYIAFSRRAFYNGRGHCRKPVERYAAGAQQRFLHVW